MNIIKSFFVGCILSCIPSIILTLLNYKYSKNEYNNVFGTYSFYLFDLLFLILFYFLNYNKDKLNKVKHNKNLILLCVLFFIISYISIFISYFTSKDFISEYNKRILLEIKDSLEEKEFEKTKNLMQQDINMNFIQLFFESIVGYILIYYISLFFYSKKVNFKS